MEVKASLKYLHISPRKVRLAANLIRKLTVREAENQLRYSSRRSAKPMLKLLHSAIADAENNFHLDKDNLYIAGIKVDEGPVLKRWRARARGAAYPINKRSSHISLILKEISPSGKNEKKGKEKKERIEKGKNKAKKIKEGKKKVRTSPRKIEKNIAPSLKEKVSFSSSRKPRIFQRKSF